MHKEIINKVSNWVLGNISHMEETAEIAEETSKLDGDMCECGCYNGGMSSIMGYVCKKNNKDIKIHLYDSFEGIPYPTEEDTEIPGHPEGVTRTGELKSTGISVANFASLYNVLSFSNYPLINYIINKGWVQETFPKTAHNIKNLSFLRIDVDLYIPTKLSLEYFYDKVVSGGYVLVHDYNTLEGCKQAVTEFLINYPEVELIQCREDGGVYWVKK